MNTSYNIRYKETDDYIKAAFVRMLSKKDYNKINVKDICTQAGINRSSFYSHYVSINELIMQYENDMTDQIVKIFSANQNYNSQTFEALFEFIYKNRVFYKAYLAANNSIFMERNKFSRFKALLIKFAGEHGEVLTATQLDYRMCFFGAGLKAICQRWIEDGCKQTPSQMSAIIAQEYNNKILYHTNYNPKG